MSVEKNRLRGFAASTAAGIFALSGALPAFAAEAQQPFSDSARGSNQNNLNAESVKFQPEFKTITDVESEWIKKLIKGFIVTTSEKPFFDDLFEKLTNNPNDYFLFIEDTKAEGYAFFPDGINSNTPARITHIISSEEVFDDKKNKQYEETHRVTLNIGSDGTLSGATYEQVIFEVPVIQFLLQKYFVVPNSLGSLPINNMTLQARKESALIVPEKIFWGNEKYLPLPGQNAGNVKYKSELGSNLGGRIFYNNTFRVPIPLSPVEKQIIEQLDASELQRTEDNSEKVIFDNLLA